MARPIRKLFDHLYEAATRLLDHDGAELSGYVAYTGILAIFPFLIFLTALAGFVGSAETANAVIGQMWTYMPPDVARTLQPVVEEVLLKRQGGLLTLGVVGTLWTASSGLEALRLSLNRAYGGTEQRSFARRRGQSVLLVLVTAVGLITIGLLTIVAPTAIRIAQDFIPVPGLAIIGVFLANYGLGALVIIGLLFACHRWLPRRDVPMRGLWPGVLLTTILALVTSTLFSLYLSFAGSYAVTYGSLGGVVLTLLFFYIAALIFTFGAEFNAVRIGAPKPEPDAARRPVGAEAAQGS